MRIAITKEDEDQYAIEDGYSVCFLSKADAKAFSESLRDGLTQRDDPDDPSCRVIADIGPIRLWLDYYLAIDLSDALRAVLAGPKPYSVFPLRLATDEAIEAHLRKQDETAEITCSRRANRLRSYSAPTLHALRGAWGRSSLWHSEYRFPATSSFGFT